MRALAFTATSLSLGITAHVMAGGVAPPLTMVAFLGILVLLSARALAGSERGLASLVAATVVVQAGVHLALMSAGAATMPGMAMPGPVMPMRLTGGMLAAHGIAALGAALLLRSAEAGLWRARRWLAVAIRRCGPVAVMVTRLLTGCTGRPSFAGQGLLLATTRLRRGPPVTA